MYITSIITVSIATLSAGALAFPASTPGNTTSYLEKRGKGTVAGFWGSNCFGPVVPGTNVAARPKIPYIQTCVKFNTPATYIGINWGGGGDRAKSLRAFGDDNCKLFLSAKPIVAPASSYSDYYDPKTKQTIGTNSCVAQKMEWGPTWKSVMYYGNTEGLDYSETL